MAGRQGTTLLERATSAVELARANPVSAMRMAEGVLDAPGLDAETEATALWAAGLAERELDALDSAHARFRSAVAIAEASGLAAHAARIRLSLALVLVYQGRTDAALVEIDGARPLLQGAEAGLCDVQHALIMTRLGRLDEALAHSLRALPLLREAGDRQTEAVLLSNLGALRVYRGEFAPAGAELEAALALARELGQQLLAARTVHNAAFLHGRRGDIPRSLALFDEADAAYRCLDDPDPYLAVLEADRAEVLLAVGLGEEARLRAEASLAALRRAENVTDQAEVLLLVARCRLASADRGAAFAAATAATTAFAAQGRRSWTALAEHVALEAADNADPGRVGRRAEAVASALSLAGWRLEEQRAQLLAGRSHLAAGDATAAARMLGAAAARQDRATAAERTLAWNAAALLAVSTGDRRRARLAVGAGLRVIEDHRATLGASELRAYASSAGVELSAIGLRLALEDRRPREALRWVESLRAVSVLLPPARPPDDAELADELGRLRVAEAALRSSATPGAAVVHRAKVRTLEAAVLRRTRRLAGDGQARRPDLHETFEALGDRALLEYVVLDGRVLGFVVERGRVRMHPLAALDGVEAELKSALFCLRRLSGDRLSETSLALAARTLDHALDALSRALVAPLLGPLGDRPVVVVPAGPIRSVPWA
ncbi:MAG TPA: hypothetical protein VFO65_08900, partial [Acidimicrobiales bacterium]|nr:hypothetical protein [Acidimicrobiales bacterium]